MTTDLNSNFYCSVLGNGAESLSVRRDVAAADFVVGIACAFPVSGYWNEAVPSVAASLLSVGQVFGVSAGIAAYCYRESAYAYSLCITVSAAPAVRKVARTVRFRRHAAPMIKRVSCGHLTRKCTALTL